jgi:chemotaxis signal transduction protein
VTIARVARFTYVSCYLDDRRVGLDLQQVERVIRAVEVTSLPQLTTPSILGTINYHGRSVAVLNLRRFLRLPEREVLPEDKMVMLHTERGMLAVVVDDVVDVIEASELDILQTGGDGRSTGAPPMVRTKDGVFYFRSLVGLLTEVEYKTLMQAMARS